MASSDVQSSRRFPAIPDVYRMSRYLEEHESVDESELTALRSLSVSEDGSGVKYWIGMAPFERRLLEIVAHNNKFNVEAVPTSEDKALLNYLFNQWSWSYDTQAFLCEAFYYEKNDNRQELYEKTLNILERLPSSHLRRRFRVDLLRKLNHNFISDLGEKDFSSVSFEPCSDDMYHWTVLLAMYRHMPEEMEFWTNGIARKRAYRGIRSNWHIWVLQYEIWQVIQMFELRRRRPENNSQVVDLFLKSEIAQFCQLSLRLPIAMLEDEEKELSLTVETNSLRETDEEFSEPHERSAPPMETREVLVLIDSFYMFSLR